MRQLVQSIKDGSLRIAEGPTPLIGPTEVLVETSFSVVSAGTERSVRNLASANLLEKARSRPDLVKQVIRRARDNGIISTARAVRSRLDEDMPLGYSASGTVIAVGESVSGIRPGMRVATGGAGHGDMQVVSGNLCAEIPHNVSDSDAAFTTIASIALHGLRLADVGIGGAVCVVGLGLIGQLTVRLALASGLRVYAVDLREWTVEIAKKAGAEGSAESGNTTTSRIKEWSRGRGVDAVIITAATPSSEPIKIASDRLRDRGSIVVVGDVGMELARTPLYLGEHTVKVARSYGPGRYDRTYEEWGVDYPVGYVPFSERRNLESVLDLIESKRLTVSDLVTHEFEFDDATSAYSLLENRESKYLGIQIRYGARKVRWSTPTEVRATEGKLAIALIGAGNFAKGTLVPSIKQAGIGDIVRVASASGISASKLAAQIGVQACTVDDAINDPAINLVVIATSHSSHAELVVKALNAGKHVFCEKPLAITEDELDRVQHTWMNSSSHLAIGFNRRHSSDIRAAKKRLKQLTGPTMISYRVSAPSLPLDHWYRDRREGGRLLGEGCHFVDTCAALLDSPVISAHAQFSGNDEQALSDNFTILMSYEDGSLASILFTSHGNASVGKERIEIHKDNTSITINDFSSIEVNGKMKRHRQDKGHVEQFTYLSKILSGDFPEGRNALDVTILCLNLVNQGEIGH